MSWFEANSYCKSVGAKLVEIESEEENVAIVEEINRGGYKNRSRFFWIGLTDANKEGTWKLASNGTTATFLNWNSRQPDNYDGNEDCAHLRTGGCPDWILNDWADLDCNKTMVKITCSFQIKAELQFTMNALCEFKIPELNQINAETETETGANLDKVNF